MGRARIGLAVLTLAALVASSGAWGQRGGGLAAECRSPALRQCLATGGDRGTCLIEAIQALPDSCRKAISQRAAARAGTLPEGWREIAFGSDPLQRLDLAVPRANGKAPLLVFVHGGGWSIGDKRMSAGQKGAHYLATGWAFASTNYRLVPQARIEDQAADVAFALALLRRQPGIDSERIVLMGHSAGAHLAALVATDPSYLQRAGVPMAAVRGVILLDGAGYDVGQQMLTPRNRAQSMYTQAFGTDPARQAALSPERHTEKPNAERWLILPVASRADSTAQSEALAAKLRSAGAVAEVLPQAGKTHMTLNQELGAAGDPTTAVVDGFLAKLR